MKLTSGITVGAVLVCLGLVAGCGGKSGTQAPTSPGMPSAGGKAEQPIAKKEVTHETVIEDMLTNMNDLASILATVKDKASADKAEPELKAASKKMDELHKQMEAMKQPSKEAEAALKQKYEKDLDAAGKELGKEMMRISKIPEAAGVLKVMEPTTEKK